MLSEPVLSASTALVLASASSGASPDAPVVVAAAGAGREMASAPPAADGVKIPRLLPLPPPPRARVWINGEEVDGSGRFGHLSRSYE